MNHSRLLAGFLCSTNPKICDILQSSFALHSLPFSTKRVVRPFQKSSKAYAEPRQDLPVEPTITIQKDPSELQRPSMIPFQVKVANSVHLVGTIDTSVKLKTISDKSYASVSIIVTEKTMANKPFWIPIIFQGDLAEVAAFHLKRNDLICVSGQLTGDNVAFTDGDSKENIKLIADTLNFVENDRSSKVDRIISKPNGASTFDSDEIMSREYKETRVSTLPLSGVVKKSDTAKNLWNNLFIDSQKWLDNREKKQKGQLSTKYPDFKHKETQDVLWLNTAPSWLVSKLDGLVFGDSGGTTKNTTKFLKSLPHGAVKKSEIDKNLWDELFIDSSKWLDCREMKQKGVFSEKSPDFKNKETGDALWLNTAPSWLLLKLDGLVFGSSDDAKKKFVKSSPQDDLWKKLIENPQEWWDNRSSKLKPTFPDFKQKDGSIALWLSSAPAWVIPKLPP